VGTLYWYAVLGTALMGLYLLMRRAGFVATASHLVVLLWAYFAAIHAVTVSQDRYHFVSIPLIAALAGLAIASLPLRRPARRSS
jgi:ABC-type branched-subunit amino acid transport system permease subunit